MKFVILLIISALTTLLAGCSTYQIPLESFEEQFKDHDPAKLNIVSTSTPFGAKQEYQTNSIDTIYCVDKNNNIKNLKKSPSLEMRITQKNGKKTIFYADQVFLRDSLICGEQSRILLYMYKCIPFNNVKKIEIQDGHKKYKYY